MARTPPKHSHAHSGDGGRIPGGRGFAQSLGEGKCLNSLGNEFEGQNAPQNAIDDLRDTNGINGGVVWIGRSVGNLSGDTYNGVDLSFAAGENARLNIVGMGAGSMIDGGTSPGWKVEDTARDSTASARIRVRDIQFSGSHGVEVIHGIEHWFTNVEVQAPTNHAFVIRGGEGFYFTDCFAEGLDTGQFAYVFQDAPNGDGVENITVTGGEVAADKVFDISAPNGGYVGHMVVTGVVGRSPGSTPWLESTGVTAKCVVDSVTGADYGGGFTTQTGDEILIGENH